jgi:regulator of sigma D
VDKRSSDYPRLRGSAKAAGAAALLDHWTDVRHKIVHQGKAVKVTADQTRQLTDFVECLADYVDARALNALK